MMFLPFTSVLIVLGLVACQSAPAPPVAPAVKAVQHDDPTIDALLVRIEEQGGALKGFSSDVIYRKDDALLNRRETRTGTLVYQARALGADGHPARLAAVFDQVIVNGRRQARQREWIFDGMWLTEIDHDRRTIIRRQIREADDPLDPLRLGGPFPLPVGQSREKVLQLFQVVRFDPASDAWTSPLADSGNTVHGLRLIPRPGVPEAKDWSTIDLVFDDATMLPIAVVATETNGDARRVRMASVQVDPVLDEETISVFQKGMPGSLPEDWKVHVEAIVPSEPMP